MKRSLEGQGRAGESARQSGESLQVPDVPQQHLSKVFCSTLGQADAVSLYQSPSFSGILHVNVLDSFSQLPAAPLPPGQPPKQVRTDPSSCA